MVAAGSSIRDGGLEKWLVVSQSIRAAGRIIHAAGRIIHGGGSQLP
jgi:hypothetical protein